MVWTSWGSLDRPLTLCHTSVSCLQNAAKTSQPGRGSGSKTLLGLQDAWRLHQWRPCKCQEQICIYISRQLQTYCDSIKFKHFKIKAAISSFLGSRKSIIKTKHQHRNNWDYSHSEKVREITYHGHFWDLDRLRRKQKKNPTQCMKSMTEKKKDVILSLFPHYLFKWREKSNVLSATKYSCRLKLWRWIYA